MAQVGYQHDDSEQSGRTNAAANDAAQDLSVSIFADRQHVRDTMRDDALAAGFRLRETGAIAALLDGQSKPIGEVVLLDCPVIDAQACAALSRLDMRAAKAGAQLVVSTSVDALDDVFACLDQSSSQILVAPSRAERVVSLGRVLARVPNLRLRELSEEDRLTLLRLTEQVGQIAQRLESLTDRTEDVGVFRLGSPASSFRGADDRSQTRLPMPDPRRVRQIIRQRRLRSKFFDGDLFADPAWDMLLDLTAARAEQARVSVTSLCIASSVPPTTALRWIGQMIDAGLMERVEDETDKRRAFIALSDSAADAMARYFAQLGADFAGAL